MAGANIVVVNPNAGGGVDPEDIRSRLTFLSDLEMILTESAGDGRKAAARAVEERAECVVSVGGDGTLHEIVNGLAVDFSRCKLAVLPAGTGNDTARSLGIPLDRGDAVECIRAGRHHSVDIIRTATEGNTVYAVNAATGGFGGAVNEAMTGEVRDFWGSLAYARAAASVIPVPPTYDVSISIDAGPKEGLRVMSIVVANGAFAAGGVSVAPGARIDDGQLAVHIVLESDPAQLLSIARSILAGRVPDHDNYMTSACKSVRIRSHQSLPISIDGELSEIYDATFEILPSRLRVIRSDVGVGSGQR